ncbi:MAG: DUF3943 domain-containing protein [Chitinophagales bacterium]
MINALKILIFFSFLLLFGIASKAQSGDSSIIVKDSILEKANSINTAVTVNGVSDDTVGHNMYGDLLNDDPVYNRKYPWWLPAIRVAMADVFNWAVARYVYKFDWARVSTSDWKYNLKKGPEWDVDGFGINFIGHPHTGSFYYNVARSNGYSYWGSLPFCIEGSILWEYLGENTRPSFNDLINTPISGMFLGEVFYRLSSNVLDDRTTGGQRVLREIIAGIINPTRALNRLTQGKMFRVTSKEVYQKEPLNITISSGIHKVNNKTGKNNHFGTGATNALLNMQLDYGDPFESRRRKPFDLFRLRVEMNYGADRKLLDHVNGYGILAGKNTKPNRLLAGLFQHYDYWRNSIFEVATLGFGGGLISRIPVADHSNIYSGIHFAIVPLAGNNTQFGPDTSEFRHYNFGGGLQAKLEETFNLNKWATIGFTGFYYWIHTYNGVPGNSLVGILRPSITLRLFKNLSIGFEHHIYHNDRFLNGMPSVHITRTEQKLFLQLFLEDSKRYGRYH